MLWLLEEREPPDITYVGNRNVDHSAIRAYGRVVNITIPATNITMVLVSVRSNHRALASKGPIKTLQS